MRRLFSYLKQYWGLLLFTLFLASVNQIASLIDPQIFRLIIDKYLTQATHMPREEFLRGVLSLLGISVGVVMISRIAKNFQDYYVNTITQKIGAAMYNQAVEHSFALPFSAFEDQRSGELLLKLQKARSDAQQLIANFINVVFVTSVGILFVLVYAFTVDVRIGLAYTLMIPVLAAITVVLSNNIKKAQSAIVVQSAALAGSTTETLRNVQLVKALGLEAQEVKRLNEVNQKILALELKKIFLIRTFSFTQGTLINLLRTSLLFLMFYLISVGELTIGEFFSLLFYSFYIFNPLSEFGNIAAQYQETRASMEQVEAILAMPREEKPIHAQAPRAIESIEFNHVYFGYEDKKEVLKDISFSVKKGQTVAFVGLSGAGKTSILKLLVGLYKPTKGKVVIGGISHNELDWDYVRSKIGLVAQETQLFAGTIKENLLFASPTATEKECKEVLKAAQAESILHRSQEGLNAKIGEGGIKLSGGEKQRLAIARALLRKPQVLIFDEATSSLDSLTEAQITKTIRNIKKVYPNLITILVAHRLSTVMHADTIYVLEKGKVVEKGTHGELLKEKGLYYALWKQQSAQE